MAARACVCGKVLGAGAFQTQYRSSHSLGLRGTGQRVHGRSRLRGSGCLGALGVRQRGRPAKPARRTRRLAPAFFLRLVLRPPVPSRARAQHRCSSRRRSPLPAPRRCRRYRHLSPHHGQRCRGLECAPERDGARKTHQALAWRSWSTQARLPGPAPSALVQPSSVTSAPARRSAASSRESSS